MNNYKIIAICGKAGSGKDTILHYLSKFKNVQEIISCTTRPIREGEKDGVNYYYLSNDEFTKKLLTDDMLEATIFNDWCYGTMRSSLAPDKWNIGVFNPDGIAILQENKGIELKVFFIYAPDKERLLRQLERETNPDCHEIIRRFNTDEKDFKFLDSQFNYTRLDNIAQGDQILCAEKIAKICNLDK